MTDTSDDCGMKESQRSQHCMRVLGGWCNDLDHGFGVVFGLMLMAGTGLDYSIWMGRAVRINR